MSKEFRTQSLMAISFITYRTGQVAEVKPISGKPEFNQFVIERFDGVAEAYNEYRYHIENRIQLPVDEDKYEKIIKSYKRSVKDYRIKNNIKY